jgi:hypothetical protein
MNMEFDRMNNEVVVAYFEVLSQRLPGDNEDNKVI